MTYVAPVSDRLKCLAQVNASESVSVQALAAGHAGPGQCVFEAPAHREAYGVAQMLRVDIPGSVPLLFDDRGNHALCLARTRTLDASTIQRASGALFTLSRIRFVVFEDIGPIGSGRLPPATLRLRYQNDWVVPLGSGTRRSSRRKLDKKLRRLREEHDGVRLAIEPSPSRAIVEGAMRLSRKKIEADGRTYLIDDAEKERLVRLFGSVGTAAILYHGEHMVACDLFVEHGLDAYAFLRGYDTDYARRSPGAITMRHAIEHFEARGFRAAHLLWGDGAYKADLGAIPVPLSSLIVPRNPGALLNPKLLAYAMRFSAPHVRERLRERPWIGEPLRRALEGFRHVRARLRSGGQG